MTSLVGPNGQISVHLVSQALVLPSLGVDSIDTARVGQALEAVIQATLPSREDVAALSLAGVSMDAARPSPADGRITFATELIKEGGDVDGAALLATLIAQTPIRAQVLVPLVLTAVSQILRLTNYHAPSREIGSKLVEAILTSSTPPETNPDALPAPTQVAPIAHVLSNLDSSKATRESQSDGSVLAALDLITALFSFAHGKYAGVLAPLLPWSQATFLRLGLMRRRHAASDAAANAGKSKTKKGYTPVAGQDDPTLRGYDPSTITPAQPDIRSRVVQLLLAVLGATPLDLPVLAASVVVPPGSSSFNPGKRKRGGGFSGDLATTEPVAVSRLRPAGYKPSILSLAHDALGNLFQGLPHDPAWLVARVLQDLHDHVLAPADAPDSLDRLPRRSLMAVLGSQVALDALLALYGRHDTPTRDEEALDVRLVRSRAAEAKRRRRVALGGPAFEQGEVVPQPIPGMPPIAEQAHVLLLALTTIRGRGMVFPDDGWYPRHNSRTTEKDEDGFDDEDVLPSLLEQGTVKAKPPTTGELYNPVLLRLLRSLAPGKLSRHALLAREILSASPQLVPAYLSKSGPAHLTATPIRPGGMADVEKDGGVTAAWLASTAFVGQVLAHPIPIPLDEEGHIRSSPPPLSTALAAILPSPPLERPIMLRALSAPDRLAQLSTLRLLLAALERIRRYAILCERAHDSIPSDEAWAASWAAVRSAAIKALPDLPSLVGLLQKVNDAPEQNVLLIDSVVSCLALYADALNRAHSNNASTPHLTAQCRLDTGRLLRLHTLAPMLEPGARTPPSEAQATFGPLVALHVLQTIDAGWQADVFHGTPGASFDLLSDAPGMSPYLVVLLRLWLNGQSLRVQRAAGGVLEAVVRKSVLFALNPSEWKAWLFALHPEQNFVDGQPTRQTQRGLQLEEVLGLMHECASRVTKLFHKYLDLAQSLTPTDHGQTGAPAVSPLMAAFVEQFTIRARKGILRERALGRTASFLARLLMAAQAAGLVPCQVTSSIASQCLDAVQEAKAPEGIKWLFSSVIPSAGSVLGMLVTVPQGGQLAAPAELEFSTAEDLHATLQASPRPLTSDKVLGFVRAAEKLQDEDVLLDLDPMHEPVPSCKGVGQSLIQGHYPAQLDVQVPPLTAQVVAHSLTVANKPEPSKVAALLALLLRSHAGPLAQSVCTSLLRDFSGWVEVAQVCTPKLFQSGSSAPACAALIVDGLLGSTDAKALQLARPLLVLVPPKTVIRAAEAALNSLRQAGQSEQVLTGAINLLLDSLALPSVTEVSHLVLSHASALLALPSSLTQSAVGVLSLALSSARQTQASLPGILSSVDAKPSDAWDGLLAVLLIAHPTHTLEVEKWLLASPTSTNCLELLHALVLSPRAALPNSKVQQLFASVVTSALSSPCPRSSALAVNVAVGVVQRGWMTPGEVAGNLLELVRNGGRTVHLSPAMIDLCTALVTVAPTDEQVGSVSLALIEHLLHLLVRAFAEHDTDPTEVPSTLGAVGGLVRARAEAKLDVPAHLALPLVEAVIRDRFGLLAHSILASTLVTACASIWGATLCTRVAAMLIGNPRFRSVMRQPDGDSQGSRLPLALTLLHLVSAGAAPADLAPRLRMAYSGSLDATDRTVFATLQLVQADGPVAPVAGLELAEGGLGEESPSPLQQLASLDPDRLKLTCRLFPRNRRFDLVDAGVSSYSTTESLAGPGSGTSVGDDQVLSRMYDPLAILSLFVSALLGQEKPQRKHLVALGSNYALGVIFCCLSSRASHVRLLAHTVLGKVLGLITGSTFPERELLLSALEALQEQIPLPEADNMDWILPALPLSTPLFAAYVLDACISPERGDEVGTVLARRAMHRARARTRQRTGETPGPTPPPVPVLRTFLAGKVEDADSFAGACARVWILEFLADSIAQGGHTEHDVGQSRYVTDHLMALWFELTVADPGAATTLSQSSTTLYSPVSGLGLSPALYGDGNRAAAHAILKIWLSLCSEPLSSMNQARQRVDFLTFVRSQQAATSPAPSIWTTMAARTALSLPSTAWSTNGREGQHFDTSLTHRIDTLLWQILCHGLRHGALPDTEGTMGVVLQAFHVVLGRLGKSGALTPTLIRGVEVLRTIWPTVQARAEEWSAARQADGTLQALPPAQAVFVRCVALIRQTLANLKDKVFVPLDLLRQVDQLTLQVTVLCNGHGRRTA